MFFGSEEELKQFDHQRGLNGNTFWQDSFRSVIIESERMFWQKSKIPIHREGTTST